MSFLNDRENHPMKPAEPRIFFMGWSMTNSIYVTVIGLFIFLFLLVSMLGRYFSRNFPLASLSLYLAHVVTLSGHLRLITLNVLRFYVSVKSRFTFHFLKYVIFILTWGHFFHCKREAPTGCLPDSPVWGMVWGSNQQPFPYRTTLQPTKPHQAGLLFNFNPVC